MKKTMIGLSLILAFSAYGQGSLTPPGAPAQTMKTLDQVEPRIPISAASYNLVHPGSYYLTTNISGVTIQSDNVTLDLMGFSIAATDGSAVYFYAAYSNVVIRNGTISSAIGHGINCAYPADNVRGLIERVRVQDCAGVGMELPGGYLVRDCEIYKCHNTGIRASGAMEVRNCHLENNTIGLSATNGSRIIGNTILNSIVTGLRVQGTGSYVADNIVKGNADNYDLAAGNQLNLLICEIPESLDWPCSVKLTGSLTCSQTETNGITVNADDVTIDLAGHALVGPGVNSGNGIDQADTYRNLTVLNGKVVNWFDGGGIYANGTASRIIGVQTSSNYYGMVVGDGSILSDCVAQGNLSSGLLVGRNSTLRDCVARQNGDAGLGASYFSTISGCVAFQNNYGILMDNGCALNDSTAALNTGAGIMGRSGSTMRNCAANNNIGDGFNLDSDCQIEQCVAQGNGNDGDGAGIHATGERNRIDGNQVTGNDRGIDVDVAGNLIVRNSASGNTANFEIVGSNSVGTISASPVGAGAWDNFTF